MKLVQTLFGLTIFFFSASVLGCQPIIEYRKAELNDAEGILSLINNYGVNDNDKIVILPKLFRLQAIESAIEKGRLFVACNKQNNAVIGYKKLFLLSDAQERTETLEQEIRCTGDQSELVDTAYFSNVDKYRARCVADRSSIVCGDNSDTCVYNGADFTHPDFRARGINTNLTDTALGLIKESVRAHMDRNKAKRLIMVYGLTQPNDYDLDGNGGSRTSSIVRSFVSFIRGVIPFIEDDIVTLIQHNRYKAFMPTFDPNATECKPLSDEQAVAGFGNVLLYSLTKREGL